LLIQVNGNKDTNDLALAAQEGCNRLCGFSNLADFQQAHRQWVEIALRDDLAVRDARWSEAVAVGNLNFVEKMKSEKRGRRIAN
jgi:hypothetical protein